MGWKVSNCTFPVAIAAYAATIFYIFTTLYDVQPTPVVDEVFHVPQAQLYCQGNFLKWDPKITTLPGLYLFSIGLNGLVQLFTSKNDCDVYDLRLTNVLCGLLLLPTIYMLLKQKHSDKISDMKLILASINLCFFPVLHWFFYFYYTDVISTFLVLLMLLMHSIRAPKAAALVGLASVITRQTNIVWVLFVCGSLVADFFQLHIDSNRVLSWQSLKKTLMRRDKLLDFVKQCCPFVVVIILFAMFVLVNGSIVVGDKMSHQATLHVPQLGYFCLFFLVFTLPYALVYAKPFVKLFKQHTAAVCFVIVLAMSIVHTNTLVHPFMLADNRHYSFYIWNRFYGKFALFRYMMVPVYLFGAYVLWQFIRNRNWIVVLSYVVCASMTFLPQQLIEFRYFILPFIIARLQLVSNSWKVLILEFAIFAIINPATILVFSSKSFMWNDFKDPQRIMW